MAKTKRTKRADGRYEETVTIGYDEKGKPIRKHIYGRTNKEVNEKINELRISLCKGLDISAQENTFSVWADHWLSFKRANIGNSQYTHYVTYINYLKGYIGDMALKDIRLLHIQTVINDLYERNPNTNKPSSKKTLKEIRGTAKQIFEFAIDNKVLDYNPADKVKIPKEAAEKEREALTNEQQRWITEMSHEMQTAVMIMLYAGLRRGELLPLLWTDIDFKKRTITVNKAVDLSCDKAVLKGTKTKAGNREVIMPDILVDYLKEIKRTNILVCPSPKGKIYTATQWRRAWNSYLYALDLKYGKNKDRKTKYDKRYKGISIDRITPHMLRHTYCTNLILAGVAPVTVKDLMGHASIRITLDIYTHITEEFKENDMNKYNDFLKNTVNNFTEQPDIPA